MSDSIKTNRLTKDDTVALWHAVKAFASMNEAQGRQEGVLPEHMAADEAMLVAARRALRKANRLRQEMGHRSTSTQAKNITRGTKP